MSARRSLLFAAVVAVMWLPAEVRAQAVGAEPAGYRASGGQIDVRGRTPGRWSGSVGVSTSSSDGGLTGGNARGLEAMLGGTLVAERLWFFGSAQLAQPSISRQFAGLPVQGSAGSSQAFDAKATAQLGERQTLVSSFSSGVDGMAGPAMTAFAPETFFSMHYTGIVSSNMFFTASATRSSGTRSLLSLQPLR